MSYTRLLTIQSVFHLYQMTQQNFITIIVRLEKLMLITYRMLLLVWYEYLFYYVDHLPFGINNSTNNCRKSCLNFLSLKPSAVILMSRYLSTEINLGLLNDIPERTFENIDIFERSLISFAFSLCTTHYLVLTCWIKLLFRDTHISPLCFLTFVQIELWITTTKYKIIV